MSFAFSRTSIADLKLTILLPEGSLGERQHTLPQLLFTAWLKWEAGRGNSSLNKMLPHNFQNKIRLSVCPLRMKERKDRGSCLGPHFSYSSKASGAPIREVWQSVWKPLSSGSLPGPDITFLLLTLGPDHVGCSCSNLTLRSLRWILEEPWGKAMLPAYSFLH